MRSALLVDRSPRPDLSAFVHGPTDAIAWRGDDGTSGCGCGRGECKGTNCLCGCGSVPYGHLDVVASGWDEAGRACGGCSGGQRRSSWATDGGPGFWGPQFGPGMFADPWGGGGVLIPFPWDPPKYSPPPSCDHPPSWEWYLTNCFEPELIPGLPDDWNDPWWFTPPTCPVPDSPEECLSLEIGTFPVDPAPAVLPPNPNHFVARPVNPATNAADELVVLLHGIGGNPTGVTGAALSYTAACYRVIALRWGGDVTASALCELLGVPEYNPAAWNDCLVQTREGKLFDPTFGVTVQLATLLARLAQDDPAGGWGSYLLPSGEPDWSQIIIAGHSEGANEAAYIWRHPSTPVVGAIMMSGGGEAGTFPVDENAPITPADWMLPQTLATSRVVGINHAQEDKADWTIDVDGVIENAFVGGWELHGMLPGPAADPFAGEPHYGTFDARSHFLRTDPMPSAGAAHASTADADIKAAHMYMVCRAGGQRIPS